MARDHADCLPCRLRLREAQRNGDRIEWGQAVTRVVDAAMSDRIPAPILVAS